MKGQHIITSKRWRQENDTMFKFFLARVQEKLKLLIITKLVKKDVGEFKKKKKGLST
jgi:hypothetical protein